MSDLVTNTLAYLAIVLPIEAWLPVLVLLGLLLFLVFGLLFFAVVEITHPSGNTFGSTRKIVIRELTLHPDNREI